jgi:poly-beta-hydroxybutyrate-responsive repressor
LSGHQPESNQPKKFLQPCLLLLIAESPGHGYDLLDRLAEFGFERDPGTLYRMLRGMEREGQVRSEWQLSPAGPGRRRYELTDAGHDQLEAAVNGLIETRDILDAFLQRFRTVGQQGVGARSKSSNMKPFGHRRVTKDQVQ